MALGNDVSDVAQKVGVVGAQSVSKHCLRLSRNRVRSSHAEVESLASLPAKADR